MTIKYRDKNYKIVKSWIRKTENLSNDVEIFQIDLDGPLFLQKIDNINFVYQYTNKFICKNNLEFAYEIWESEDNTRSLIYFFPENKQIVCGTLNKEQETNRFCDYYFMLFKDKLKVKKLDFIIKTVKAKDFSGTAKLNTINN